jgi:hypothetical protein
MVIIPYSCYRFFFLQLLRKDFECLKHDIMVVHETSFFLSIILIEKTFSQMPTLFVSSPTLKMSIEGPNVMHRLKRFSSGRLITILKGEQKVTLFPKWRWMELCPNPLDTFERNISYTVCVSLHSTKKYSVKYLLK